MESKLEHSPVQISPSRLAVFLACPCEISTRAITKNGYAQIRVNGKIYYHHRWIYSEYHKVKLKPTELVRHKCDNRACIEITHLELGTHKDNSKDMMDRGRSLRGSQRWNAKLTEEDVLKIRQLHKRTLLTMEDLAKKFNVSYHTVHKIIYRRSWKYI